MKDTICHCMLIEQNMEPHCKHDCEDCGWNPTVHKKRQKYIREHGLTKCEDGLKRLIMDDKPATVEIKLSDLFAGKHYAD